MLTLFAQGCKAPETNEAAADEGRKIAEAAFKQYNEGKSLLNDSIKGGSIDRNRINDAHAKLFELDRQFLAAAAKFGDALAGQPATASKLHSRYSKLKEAYGKQAEVAKIDENIAEIMIIGSAEDLDKKEIDRATQLENEIAQLLSDAK